MADIFLASQAKKNYIAHLKGLVCGINASISQLCGCTFILCNAHLNLAPLLHKKVLLSFLLASTVTQKIIIWCICVLLDWNYRAMLWC